MLRLPKPPRLPGAIGRPLKHGPEFALERPVHLARAGAHHDHRDHPLRHREATAGTGSIPGSPTAAAGWPHDGALPVIDGTLIRLKVDHLPRERDPKPLWLWSSATGATAAEIDRCWQSFLRRFDLEHTFRLFKQTLGWTAPKIRTPQAADLWTWLIIAAHTQLRLARPSPPTCAGPGKTRTTQPVDPGPGPTGVSEPPRAHDPARRRAETLQARSRTPTRVAEPQLRAPLRRREDQTGRCSARPATAHGLKIKLRDGRAAAWGRPSELSPRRGVDVGQWIACLPDRGAGSGSRVARRRYPARNTTNAARAAIAPMRGSAGAPAMSSAAVAKGGATAMPTTWRWSTRNRPTAAASGSAWTRRCWTGMTVAKVTSPHART